MASPQNGPSLHRINQPLPPPPAGQYRPRRTMSYDNGDERAFGARGESHHSGAYGSYGAYGGTLREETTDGPEDELFLGSRDHEASYPSYTPATPQSHLQSPTYSPTASHQTYDPRRYAQPEVQYEARPLSYVNRAHTTGAHQPYNPQAYQESTLVQHSSFAEYDRRTSIVNNNPLPPLPQQPYTPPLLSLSEQRIRGVERGPSLYGPRPTTQRAAEQAAEYQGSPSRHTDRGIHGPSSLPPLPVAPQYGSYASESWRAVLPGRQPSSGQGRYSYTNITSPGRPPDIDLPTLASFQDVRSRHRSASEVPHHSVAPRLRAEESVTSEVSLPSPPAPPPPEHSPQRSAGSGRHPQSRPLPGPPPGASLASDYFGLTNGQFDPNRPTFNQEELFNEVEEAVMRSGSGANDRSRRADTGSASYYRRPSHTSFTPSPAHTPDLRNGSFSSSNLSPELIRQDPNVDAYSDASDAEADAGLAAMRMAEEQEQADEARRRGSGNASLGVYGYRQQAVQHTLVEEENDSDFVTGVDVESYGGGNEVRLSYGGDPSVLAAGHSNVGSSANRSQDSSAVGSVRRSNHSLSRSLNGSHRYSTDETVPFPDARVDIYGTGGLSEPTAHLRRLSFDEGDETGFVDEQEPDTEPPELFYHPGMSTSRPLPPPPAEARIPPTGTYMSDWGLASTLGYPTAPDAYQSRNASSTSLFGRASSLVSHSSTPPVPQPARALTEWQKKNRIAGLAGPNGDALHDLLMPQHTTTMGLDLPSLPTSKRFHPSKLGPADFKKCSEPWALSSVVSWLRAVAEGEPDLREHTIVDALIALFEFKVPTMQLAELEALSSRLVKDMLEAGVLEPIEEWVKFGTGSMTGVLFQLTGMGCYAPKLHNYETRGRCYAHHCQRTLKKVNLQDQLLRPTEDWVSFYKVKKEDLEGVDKKEIERQNNLHEIVQTEEDYIKQLHVLLVLYRDALAAANPPIITPKRISGFLKDVFGKVEPAKRANEDFLLAQLKYRQQEQGPWILGFSDIFREWIRKGKNAYIEYAAAFPKASFLVRQELERNILFRTFLEKARTDERSKRLGWDTYLKAPITRLQRYGLLLGTVLKNMGPDLEERSNLQVAMEEIKAVAMECDARVAETSRKVDLSDLSSRLVLRPNMDRVELNLNHLGRELLYKGDLQRTGTSRFTWLDITALLFDHYLVLAKTVIHHDSSGGLKYEKYDVSKLPIPMDLLVLESTNDPPVTKSSVKGFSAVKDPIVVTGSPQDNRLTKSMSISSPSPGTLNHSSTSSTVGSGAANSLSRSVTTIPAEPTKDEKILFPFRIKHLGKEVYTLYAPTAHNRQEWCDKIVYAKTKHAASLFAQSAEPFRLRVMADTAFAYDSVSGGQKSVLIKGTPLDRAIDEVEKKFESKGRPGPVCRAKVNCATTFTLPYGKSMVAVGTDYGVYLSEIDNPRGWNRAIQTQRVTQIAVLEEFSIMLLIQDKNLVAYHLDTICPINGAIAPNDSARKAPQKLSGSRDVGFFTTGRMKDRMLVFYKKREGLSSTFKVLEPVFQKSTERKSRLMRWGTTEFFREYDSFYIPTECFGINLFQSSLAISSSKGFEVLTLDKKVPISIPDLRSPEVASIAQRLASQSPLGMFRLNPLEYLLVYEECAVYVNKHGDISRSVIMEFVGRAKAACVRGKYLCLFDGDFVEVRNAEDGRLRQVVAGRDVKMLDDGGESGGGVWEGGAVNGSVKGATGAGEGAGETVKFSMQHPRQERCQLVLEFVLNEAQRE